MEKELIKIQPITKDELNHLKGGFVSMEGTIAASGTLINVNCGNESGWINYNCSCGACKKEEGGDDDGIKA